MSGYLNLHTLADDWNDEVTEATEAESISYGELAEIESRYWELCDQLGIDKTPDDLKGYANDYEPTLIPEHEFEDYARDLAEDIGAIDPNAGWPLSCIDWEKAAQELAMDYTTVTFDGIDYLMRS